MANLSERFRFRGRGAAWARYAKRGRGARAHSGVAGFAEWPRGGIQQVGVNAKGQLGVRGSSARFKEAIKPMGGQSVAILSLRPVSFRYKKELDPSGDTQFGLVAEEVAKVAPELVMKDASGKPFSVRYEEVNAMLLNEFLKEHKKSEQEAAEIAQLKAGLAKQQAAIEALTKQMQKVSAHPEASESKPLLTAADR